MSRDGFLAVGGLALVALLYFTSRKQGAQGGSGGSGVWEPDYLYNEGGAIAETPTYTPSGGGFINGWESDYMFTEGGSIGYPPGYQPPTGTGRYTVTPVLDHDYYAHLVDINVYTQAGMSETRAHAQARFDLADADFGAGKITLNERDQALLNLEIVMAKERGDDFTLLAKLLEYLQSHPEFSRFDLAGGLPV